MSGPGRLRTHRPDAAGLAGLGRRLSDLGHDVSRHQDRARDDSAVSHGRHPLHHQRIAARGLAARQRPPAAGVRRVGPTGRPRIFHADAGQWRRRLGRAVPHQRPDGGADWHQSVLDGQRRRAAHRRTAARRARVARSLHRLRRDRAARLARHHGGRRQRPQLRVRRRLCPDRLRGMGDRIRIHAAARDASRCLRHGRAADVLRRHVPAGGGNALGRVAGARVQHPHIARARIPDRLRRGHRLRGVLIRAEAPGHGGRFALLLCQSGDRRGARRADPR